MSKKKKLEFYGDRLKKRKQTDSIFAPKNYDSKLFSSEKNPRKFSEDIFGAIDKNKPYYETQLEKGTNIEMEHTRHRDIAEQIAKDHLYENPKYYSKFNPKKKSKEFLVN